MIDLQLDITDLKDLKLGKNEFMEKDLLDFSKKHLRAGSRIVIKRSYDFVQAFTQEEKFEQFWRGLFD